MKPDDIANRFNFHLATSTQAVAHEQIQVKCRWLAVYLNDTLPEGREKSLAITSLEETMMWANASIARND